jgi:lecithin-cholesterol acyltransferase
MKAAKSLPVATFAAWLLMAVTAVPVSADTLTPIVVFPAFHFTILEVKVKDQSVCPEYPASGQFEDGFLNPNPPVYPQFYPSSV